jgi:uncharacterized protein (TIGR00369 family)
MADTQYEVIRSRMGSSIPLNRLLGIEVAVIGDGAATARLPFHPEVTNHIGSVHATAIYGLAEAASGAAIAGAFADDIDKLRAVATGSTIRFLHVARSELTAEAAVEGERAVLRAELAAAGRLVLPVAVAVRDQRGVTVASADIVWHLRRARSSVSGADHGDP